MSFSNEVKKELINLKMWDSTSILNQDEQFARILIREAFIKSGFINNPNKEYHLEILFKSKREIDKLRKIINNLGIEIKSTKKGAQYMLYLKEGQEISSFLALMGANKAVIKFEEIRVIKETRNNINRLVNCETANLNKTISAAIKQIGSIRKLKQSRQFNKLNEDLKEIAKLRLENPNATYKELGMMLSKPIGKSGVSHRLDKIVKMSEICNDGVGKQK